MKPESWERVFFSSFFPFSIKANKNQMAGGGWRGGLGSGLARCGVWLNQLWNYSREPWSC